MYHHSANASEEGDDDSRISKRLTLILRYQFNERHLIRYSDGFVSFRDLCVRHFRRHYEEDVRRAAENSIGKRGKRFEFCEDEEHGPLIRVLHETGHRTERNRNHLYTRRQYRWQKSPWDSSEWWQQKQQEQSWHSLPRVDGWADGESGWWNN